MLEKGIPRHDYQIKTTEGNVMGKVTSGTISPVMGIGIGMGYVTIENAEPGTSILICVRNNNLKAEVQKRPMITK